MRTPTTRYSWPIGPSQPVYLREGEILLFSNTSEYQCNICHGALMFVMVCWDRRITSDPFGTMGEWQPGEDRFSGYRHADGSAPHNAGVGSFEYGRSQCSKCKAFSSFDTVQGAYGDTITCNNCGDSRYYSIGD